MSLAPFLKKYLLALVVFGCIDFVWLALVARTFYIHSLGFIMADSPNWGAAILFYFIFILGLVYFVLMPLVQNKSPWKIFLVGAAYGFVTYATYDLTNLATLEAWPIGVTVIDLIWGSFISGSTALIVHMRTK